MFIMYEYLKVPYMYEPEVPSRSAAFKDKSYCFHRNWNCDY